METTFLWALMASIQASRSCSAVEDNNSIVNNEEDVCIVQETSNQISESSTCIEFEFEGPAVVHASFGSSESKAEPVQKINTMLLERRVRAECRGSRQRNSTY